MHIACKHLSQWIISLYDTRPKKNASIKIEVYPGSVSTQCASPQRWHVLLHCHVVNVFPTWWNRLAVQTRLSRAFGVNTLQHWPEKSVTSGSRVLIDCSIDWLAFGVNTLQHWPEKSVTSGSRVLIDWLIDWLAFGVNTFQHWPEKSVTSGSRVLIDWLSFGFGTSTVPMHLGLNYGPFVPHINSWEPCCFAKLPDGPQTYTLDVLWVQEEGAQIHMSKWRQSFIFTVNVGRGFFLCSTPGNRVYCTWSEHRYEYYSDR